MTTERTLIENDIINGQIDSEVSKGSKSSKSACPIVCDCVEHCTCRTGTTCIVAQFQSFETHCRFG